MSTGVNNTHSHAHHATLQQERLADLHQQLDRAIEAVRTDFGAIYPMYIAGTATKAVAQFEDHSPIDTRILLGRFQSASRDDAAAAVTAAQRAFPAWSARPWDERVDTVRRIGQTIHARRLELSALMGYESGKSRMECLGDVEEAADIIEYYCRQFEEHDGFVRRMQSLRSHEETLSLLRPYGVWAVIAPFNFPLTLAAGPISAAVISGNSVVFKPASDTPLLGLKLYELTTTAGLPADVLNIVTGLGKTAGQALLDDPRVDGIVFTGSTNVGMKMIRENAQQACPRPLIIEMGGKNPAIVMRSASLDTAAQGIVRSAFSAQGQKCSACSRVYVERSIKERLLDQLIERTRSLQLGNPLHRNVSIGPVINQAAVDRFDAALAQARAQGGRILTGGHRHTEGDLAYGFFVEPTIIDSLPHDSSLFQQELFVPITLVSEVSSLEEAMSLANSTEYGLTAGLYSENEAEIQRFFTGIHAGVTYVNRRAGATTGAWPGVNSFGGWKASGSTGRGSGGPYYVQQFMHEQSRVRVRERAAF
jgi:1-pyrroline-5-carboxylate dehydrogenase